MAWFGRADIYQLLISPYIYPVFPDHNDQNGPLSLFRAPPTSSPLSVRAARDIFFGPSPSRRPPPLPLSLPLPPKMGPNAVLSLVLVLGLHCLVPHALGLDLPPHPQIVARGEMKVGSSCSDEGQWNCMGDSWQRCAAGVWTKTVPTADNIRCSPVGLADDVDLKHPGDDDRDRDHDDDDDGDDEDRTSRPPSNSGMGPLPRACGAKAHGLMLQQQVRPLESTDGAVLPGPCWDCCYR